MALPNLFNKLKPVPTPESDYERTARALREACKRHQERSAQVSDLERRVITENTQMAAHKSAREAFTNPDVIDPHMDQTLQRLNALAVRAQQARDALDGPEGLTARLQSAQAEQQRLGVAMPALRRAVAHARIADRAPTYIRSFLELRAEGLKLIAECQVHDEQCVADGRPGDCVGWPPFAEYFSMWHPAHESFTDAPWSYKAPMDVSLVHAISGEIDTEKARARAELAALERRDI